MTFSHSDRSLFVLSRAVFGAVIFFNLSCPHQSVAPMSSEELSATTSMNISSQKIDWQSLAPDSIQLAHENGKRILLYVGTKWCHWCHVMDEKSWSNADVINLVNAHYIPIRVDADSNPSISDRYDAWGWPAIIVITTDGKDVLRHRGFMNPKDTIRKLTAAISAEPILIDAPEQQVSASAASRDGNENERQLLDTVTLQLDGLYAKERGGWGGPKKYPFHTPMWLNYLRAQHGQDASLLRDNDITAEHLKNLLDPTWGGMYQYSTHNDWTHPHTEKLALVQGRALSLYADAVVQLGKHRDGGENVLRYVLERLRDPETGLFYANQDADATSSNGKKMHGPDYYSLDDADRTKFGTPEIDRSLFSSHTGYIIAGAAAWSMATADTSFLPQLARAFAALQKHHRVSGGLYVHARGQSTYYLHDQIWVGWAALALFEATLDPQYRDAALEVGKTIALFQTNAGDFRAEKLADGVTPILFHNDQTPTVDSAHAARLLYRLSLLTDVKEADDYKERAKKCAAALNEKRRLKIEGRNIGPAGQLAFELIHPPLHIAIAGKPSADRRALLEVAHQSPTVSRIIETAPESRFGIWDKPVGFVCDEVSCSRPAFTPSALQKTIADKIQTSH